MVLEALETRVVADTNLVKQDTGLQEFKPGNFQQKNTTEVDYTKAPRLSVPKLEDLYLGMRKEDIALGRMNADYRGWLTRDMIAPTMEARYELIRRMLK